MRSTGLHETRTLLQAGLIDPIKTARFLFGQGYQLDRSGNREQADSLYRKTIKLLETLHSQRQPRLTTLSIARLAFYHAMNLYQLGRHCDARASFAEAVRFFDSLVRNGVTSAQMEELARCMLWLARSQYLCGEFQLALNSYRRTIALWRNLALFAASVAQKQRYHGLLSATLFGYARTLSALQQHALSKVYKSVAENILRVSVPNKFMLFPF